MPRGIIPVPDRCFRCRLHPKLSNQTKRGRRFGALGCGPKGHGIVPDLASRCRSNVRLPRATSLTVSGPILPGACRKRSIGGDHPSIVRAGRDAQQLENLLHGRSGLLARRHDVRSPTWTRTSSSHADRPCIVPLQDEACLATASQDRSWPPLSRIPRSKQPVRPMPPASDTTKSASFDFLGSSNMTPQETR